MEQEKRKVKDLHISGDETVTAYGRLYGGAYIVNAMSLPYRKLKEKGLTRKDMMLLMDTRQTHSEAAWGKYLPEFLRFLLADDNTEPGN